MAAFATFCDLEARWRPLSEAERTRADVLLEDASELVRSLNPNIDEQIAVGIVREGVAKAVACAIVKRAMQSVGDYDGITQMSETTGPFTQSASFANPTGDLYLTKDERRRLKIGSQKAGSVDLIAVEDES